MTAEKTRDQIADQIAAELGHSFDGEIIAGGHYVPLVRDGRTIYLSGRGAARGHHGGGYRPRR